MKIEMVAKRARSCSCAIATLCSCFILFYLASGFSTSKYSQSRRHAKRRESKAPQTRSSGNQPGAQRASADASVSRAQLLLDLQNDNRCIVSPQCLLHFIGRQVISATHIDPDGSLTSLVLVRLMKQLISIDNLQQAAALTDAGSDYVDASISILSMGKENLTESSRLSSLAILESLIEHASRAALDGKLSDINSYVDLTKAASVIARILSKYSNCGIPLQIIREIVECWNHLSKKNLFLEPYQLSGLKWAFDCFHSVYSDNSSLFQFPDYFQLCYSNLNLPFCIIPNSFESPHKRDLSVQRLLEEVDFRVDEIQTQSNRFVLERRQTAWQGDHGVSPFEYSGKSMPRDDWSPLVRGVRNDVYVQTGIYYDCCLLNHYPDGSSGMRYHSDPDQGTLWGYDTAVVSVGATRRFCFRPIDSDSSSSVKANSQSSRPTGSPPVHSFYVLHGDVAHMFHDCQARFQHTVKKADRKDEKVPRASLVFKKQF